MKKLKVILYEPSGGGGIYHYTYSLAGSLSKAGLDVTILTRQEYELKDKSRNFNISDQLGRSKSKIFITKIINSFCSRIFKNKVGIFGQNSHQASDSGKVIRKKKLLTRFIVLRIENILSFILQGVDIVHVQWLEAPKYEYYFFLFLKFLRFPIVYTVHNILPHSDESIENKIIYSRIYGVVDKLIVHCEQNKEELLSLFNINPKKIHVIPHGSYDIFFDDGIPNKINARHELNLPIEKKVILFFGGIRRYKGLEILVDSFISLSNKMENVVLLIAGKEGGDDEEEKKYYRNYLKNISLYNNIICAQEIIPFEKVKYYFSAADLVVLPYIKIYQSGVLFLAYAAGKPVVVTDSGGLRESVVLGKSGYIVPPKDPKALEESISDIFQDPSRVVYMEQHVKLLAETRYSWTSIANLTKSVYFNL